MDEHLTPSEIGARAEAAVAKALADEGKTVLVPLWAAHARYDLVYEDEAGFHRVQVKTGRVIGEVVSFRACSNTNNEPKRYDGEVEFLGVYCRHRDEVYLLPVDDLPLRPSLRLAPPRNNQRTGIRWARDYRIGREERAVYDARAVTAPRPPPPRGRRGARRRRSAPPRTAPAPRPP